VVHYSTWLASASAAVERLEARLDDSNWLPLLVLAALSFAIYFVADVELQIYSIRSLIVFVLVGL
jgi:hypothetical protein